MSEQPKVAPAGIGSNDSPEVADNTAIGDPSAPDNLDANSLELSKGERKRILGEGVSMGLRYLGFETTNLKEAKEAIESLRANRPQPNKGTQTQTADDITTHPSFRELAQVSAETAKERDAYKDRISQLEADADVARQLAIKQAAIEHGVGIEQAEYFLSRHGGNLRLERNDKGISELVVVGISNGAEVTGIESVGDYFKSVLDKSPFLLGRVVSPGSGNAPGPIDDPDEAKSGYEKWRASKAKRYGLRSPGETNGNK